MKKLVILFASAIVVLVISSYKPSTCACGPDCECGPTCECGM